jgi:hypothetical protein
MKRWYLAIPYLILAACFAACGGGNPTPASEPAAVQSTPVPGIDGNIPVEDKLAVGTLLLEDTDLAVSAGEAAELLPLWKAVRSLSSSDTATGEEIQGLYDQIQETMTAEQVAAIGTMEITAETMASLREDLGIEAGPIGSRGAGLGNLTEEQRAAMIERFQSQNPGFEPPAGGFAAGGPPPSGGAPPEGGAFPGGGSTGGFQGTPDPTRLASMANRAGRGMNNLFLDPLIQLLQERAGG